MKATKSPRIPALVGAALALAGCAAPRPAARPERAAALAGVRTFACCYRRDIEPRDLEGFDLAILGVDVARPPSVLRAGSPRLLLGYVSIGEAERARPYWSRCAGRPFLVEENPSWPGAVRVDPRDAEWRAIVLERAEAVCARGFDGLFLDTADTAEHLERADPARFRGAVEAMVRIVLAIRERHPAAILVLNQGLALYPGVRPAVDAALAESLFATYDFALRRYGPAPSDAWHRARLERFAALARGGLPVLTIEYAPAGERALVAAALSHARARGFVPYVSSIELDTVRRDALEPPR